MILDGLITRARNGIAKRRRYNQLADEIYSLSERDLVDLRADRGDMLNQLRKQIYG